MNDFDKKHSNGSVTKAGRTGFQPVNTLPDAPQAVLPPVNNGCFQPINPWKSSSLNIQKRQLPHLSAKGATYFVTFRCRKGMGLSEQARHEVLSAMLYWNGKRIDLDAAVVMPDHVHMVFRIISFADNDRIDADRQDACPTPTVSKILHSIKSFSSNRINNMLGRKGSFWLADNFGHIIRNETDWQEKITYIMENPVKKGLADKPSSYQWLWVRKDND